MLNLDKQHIAILRQSSRKLLRELGILRLDKASSKKSTSHWHALLEISKTTQLTVSGLSELLLLSPSATSRMIKALIEQEMVGFVPSSDKREKYLRLTDRGQMEVETIDEFSNLRIKGAFEFLSETDQQQIIDAIKKYADALEQSRKQRNEIKIHTLSTSRVLRKQIINMIETIQRQEFSLPVTDALNSSILKAEEDFYYYNSYNFWYAINKEGTIIASIGLKKIDEQTAEIKKFFVDPNYRGKGLAQKLISVLISAAIKHNFQCLYLGTVGSLERAQRFYEKYGFISIQKQQLPENFLVCPIDTLFFKAEVNIINDKLALVV